MSFAFSSIENVLKQRQESARNKMKKKHRKSQNKLLMMRRRKKQNNEWRKEYRNKATSTNNIALNLLSIRSKVLCSSSETILLENYTLEFSSFCKWLLVVQQQNVLQLRERSEKSQHARELVEKRFPLLSKRRIERKTFNSKFWTSSKMKIVWIQKRNAGKRQTHVSASFAAKTKTVLLLWSVRLNCNVSINGWLTQWPKWSNK